MLECGSVVKVVKEPSVYRGGEWFRDHIKTRLPYVETVTPCNRCDEIPMDEDNLVGVRTNVSHVHVHLRLGTIASRVAADNVPT